MEGIRMACTAGRAALEVHGRLIDVEKRSGGKFSSDPMSVLSQWDAFCDWARKQGVDGGEPAVEARKLDLCVPRPRCVFGIGVNYKEHGREADMELPKSPMIFAKFLKGFLSGICG